jgi:hypothetical protein
MSVLSQALFTLVSSHLVFFSLLTTWHNTFGFARHQAERLKNSLF